MRQADGADDHDPDLVNHTSNAAPRRKTRDNIAPPDDAASVLRISTDTSASDDFTIVGAGADRVLRLPERELDGVDVLGGVQTSDVEPGTPTRTVQLDQAGGVDPRSGQAAPDRSNEDDTADAAQKKDDGSHAGIALNGLSSRGGARGTTIIAREGSASPSPEDRGSDARSVRDPRPNAPDESVNPYSAGADAPQPNPYTPLVAPPADPDAALAAPTLRVASAQPDQTASVPPIVQPLDPARVRRPRRVRNAVGRLVKLVVVLALLAGAGVAAYLYVWPMVAPNAWSDEAAPFAEAIEAIPGAEFDESFELVAETPAVFNARRGDELFAQWESLLPTWRAFGLASGDSDRAVLDSALSDWGGAHYSVSESLVLHDRTLAGSLHEAQVTQQFALALLDQQRGWTAAASAAGLDSATVVEAQAVADATAIQRATIYSTPIAAPEADTLAALPPVAAFRLLAPVSYAELYDRDVSAVLSPDAAAVQPTPSAASAALGGPATTMAPVDVAARTAQLRPPVVAAPAPATVPADNVRPAGTFDRATWYLAFAAFLDAPTAFAASETIAASSVAAPVESGGCAFATFGVGAAGSAQLGAALERWAAAAPLAMSASVTELADGTLQLRSCDPGVEVQNGPRSGVAFELLGWRLAEQAVVASSLAAGASVDVESALASVNQAGVPFDLASAARMMSPGDLAAFAEERVDAILG